MKIVLASDSWGGFLSAPEVCRRVADALADLDVEVKSLPMADGGEGTAACLAAHELLGPPRKVETHDALGRPITVSLSRLGGGPWFVEAAHTVGLPKREHAPLRATSHGLGELLSQLEGDVIVGLGGSATVDGGIGLAAGLGITLLDQDGDRQVAGPMSLSSVRNLVGSPPPRRLRIWSDVTTTLLDSARIYGRQKGLDAAGIEQITRALRPWAKAVNRWRQGRDAEPVPLDLVGGGAAGGLGWALVALLDGQLHDGADAVARAIGLPAQVRDADLVITGEGRLDATSLAGKVVGAVHRVARPHAEVWAFVGQVRSDLPEDHGLDRVLACPQAGSHEAGFQAGLRLLRREVDGWLANPP